MMAEDDDGSDALEGAADGRRVIRMTQFPGCSAFCTGMFVVLLSSTSKIPTSKTK